MTNILGIQTKEIGKLAKYNYLIIILLGIFVSIISQFYNLLSLKIILLAVLINLFVNLIVHVLSLRKAKPWAQTAAFTFSSMVMISTIGFSITFFNPETRPAALLIFVPAIVLQTSLSLFFGIMVIIEVAVVAGVLYLFQVKSLVSYDSHASFVLIYFFLIVLGVLANYSMELLRKKEREIQRIAKINKNLYQMSKSTSDEVFRNMKEALVVVDENLKIIRHNEAFSKLVEQNKDLTNENFKKFSDLFGLNITDLTNQVIENKINESVTITTKDNIDNEYQTTLSKLPLKENKNGFCLIISKKANPWGRVYDSKTGLPVCLAIIRLIRTNDNKIIETKVTNDDGNFGFMVPNGEYRLVVSKNGFVFPSNTGGSSYKGENFNLSTNLVNISIALDSTE